MNSNPFNFHKKTPKEVKAVIEALYENKHRARFFYGDLETGTAWMEEYDVMGTVGKSTGPKPHALLINNARSMGGGALTSSIVKIVDVTTRNMPYNSGVLYEHPKFNNPADRAQIVPVDGDIPSYMGQVNIDGECHARFRTLQGAKNWIAFMQGKRFSK